MPEANGVIPILERVPAGPLVYDFNAPVVDILLGAEDLVQEEKAQPQREREKGDINGPPDGIDGGA
ncbi:hypothetical protein ES705_27551 [subsurface metagenome]